MWPDPARGRKGSSRSLAGCPRWGGAAAQHQRTLGHRFVGLAAVLLRRVVEPADEPQSAGGGHVADRQADRGQPWSPPPEGALIAETYDRQVFRYVDTQIEQL